MQTFLCYPLFKDSARCLDDKRLGKQRVECLQILKCLRTGPEQLSINPSSKSFKYKDGMYRRKTPWYNHPAAQMWIRYEKSLAIYGLYICNEWIKRGFQDTCFSKIQQFIPNYKFKENYIDYSGLSAQEYPCPSWLGNPKFHAAHRSNLLRKNPEWYGQFGWTEPNDLPYFWPTKTI